MSEETTTDDTSTTEADVTDTEVQDEQTAEDTVDADEMFPRKVVEDLRQENGKYRQRAQQSDQLARRLHTELVRSTARLADPTDLDFDDTHLEDPEALTAAIDELLERKPHLASRRPTGDIGQGQRGGAAEPFSLLGLLKSRT